MAKPNIEIKEGPDPRMGINSKWVVYVDGESCGWCTTKEAAEKVKREIEQRSQRYSLSKSEMKRVTFSSDKEK